MPIDSRSFVVKPVTGEKSLRAHVEEQRREGARRHWWATPEDQPEELAKAVFASLQTIKGKQRDHREDFRFWNKVYGDQDNLSGPASPEEELEDEDEATLPDNVIRQGIETRQSHICLDQSRPAYSTSGGKWSQRKRAKELNKFVDAHFYESRVDELAPRVWLDDEKSGMGVAKVYEKDGRMCVERVLPWEITVDEEAAKYGEPPEYFQDRNIPKAQLFKDFPEHADIIERASADTASLGGTRNSQSNNSEDYAHVIEVWRPASGKDRKDGRHAIVMDSGTLSDGKWEETRPPLVFHITRPPAQGFRGQGMVERLWGYQCDINRLNDTKGQIISLCSIPQWLKPKYSRVADEDLTNEVGGIITYDGPTPPTKVAASFVPAEYFEEIRNIKQEVLKECGISEFMAAGVKPVGIDSAPAQRTYQELTNKRLAESHKAHQRFRMDLGELLIDGARRIYRRSKEEYETAKERPEKRPGYRVRRPAGGAGFEEIDWAKIDLDADAYVTRPSPISSIPDTWTGKLQSIMEMMSLFGTRPEQALVYVRMPDPEQFGLLTSASLECAEYVISRIVEDGKYTEPEPYFDLAMHQELALKYYNLGIVHRCPEKKMALLRQYMDALNNRVAEMNPPAPAAPPGPPAPQLPPPPGAVPDMGPGLLPVAEPPPGPPLPLAA